MANKAIDKKEVHQQMEKKENFTTMRLGWISKKTGQAKLFLEYYDINEVEMLTVSDTKALLLIWHSYINQAYLLQHTINLPMHRWTMD